MITEEEFNHWKNHPVTKKIITILDGDRIYFKDAWATGATIGNELLNARWVGQVEVINKMINIRLSDIEQGE